MYNRFDFGIHPRECLEDLLKVTYNHNKSLKGHIDFLKEKINKLKELKNEKKLNLINTDLVDAKQNLLSKQNSIQNSNSIDNQSIKSFDSINSSLKIVEECMQRLQMKHNQSISQSDLSSTNLSNESNEKTNLNLNELLNCLQSVALDWQNLRSVRKCACGGSFEQTNNRFSNCWCCGLLLCCRCLDKRIKLPGLLFNDSESQSETEKNSNQSTNNNQIKENEALNNQKNEQLNNLTKYKVHPLEQLDQSLDHKSTNKLIEPIERTKPKTNNFKHPLEENENDELDVNSFEPIEPLELGIECDEDYFTKNANNLIDNLIDNSLANRNEIKNLLYDLVPVCASCYRQMNYQTIVKAN